MTQWTRFVLPFEGIAHTVAAAALILLATFASCQIHKDPYVNLDKGNLENVELVTTYTKEFFKDRAVTKPSELSFGFFKQKNSSSLEDHEIFKRTGLDYTEIDFFDESLYRNNALLQKLLAMDARLQQKLKRKKAQDPLLANKEYLRFLTSAVFSLPRNINYDFNKDAKIKSILATYLWQKLGALNLISGMHSFRPTQFLHTYDENIHTPHGDNVIGILPGRHWGTSEDKYVIIGAHWDTVPVSPGLDDNASGVAAVLDVARALVEAECQLAYSVIFIFFDLEENGVQGSDAFVQDFLVRHLLEPLGYPGVQGAFIVDSIFNYNAASKTQEITKDMVLLVPDSVQSIQSRNSTGDFIALYGRPYDLPLTRRFLHYWTLNNPPEAATKPYRSEEMILHKINKPIPELSTLVEHTNFLRSDHSRFWMSKNEKFSASFRSVLLTDTGPLRGAMRQCYHKSCDSLAYNTTADPFADLEFFSSVVQSLIDTTVDATEAEHCQSDRHLEASNIEKQSDYFMTTCKEDDVNKCVTKK